MAGNKSRSRLRTADSAHWCPPPTRTAGRRMDIGWIRFRAWQKSLSTKFVCENENSSCVHANRQQQNCHTRHSDGFCPSHPLTLSAMKGRMLRRIIWEPPSDASELEGFVTLGMKREAR